MKLKYRICTLICFLLCLNDVHSQLINNQVLNENEKFIWWVDGGLGANMFSHVNGFSGYYTFEANSELLHGIVTAKYMYAEEFNFNTSGSNALSFALLYGLYDDSKIGITCISIGLSYCDIQKATDSNDDGLNTLENFNTLGLVLQSTSYLTFGKGPGLGLGFTANLNPHLTYIGLNFNLGFGNFK